MLHSDAKSWDENWEELRRGPDGGQASSKVGRRRDGSVPQGFIKILNKQKERERRVRLYTEAASLETLAIPGVPRLLETNARHYDDHSYSLFLVTEFIVGATLRELEFGFAADQAIDWALELVDILDACHKAKVIHRDIKPENCIAGKDGRFYLVDFGLAFREESDVTFEIPAGQELGNRFLRLPELHADSPNKNDPRSDLTLCVGILFYLLTRMDPRILIDDMNKFPHQRDAALAKLKEADCARLDRLLSLFDRGFDPHIDKRFQSAEALHDALVGCLAPHDETGETPQAIFDRIREVASSPRHTQAKEVQDRFGRVTQQIYDLTSDICANSNGLFSLCSGPGGFRAVDLTQIYSMGFLYQRDSRILFVPAYELRHVGSEVIVQLWIEKVSRLTLRVPSGASELDASALDRLRVVLLGRLESIVRF
jgi:eukaryotic-like serine/threonine-protein kinase